MAMGAYRHHLPTYLAFALFLAFALAPLAAGDPLGKLCGSVNYTANSTYQSNIRRLTIALPKSTSSSPALVVNATIGVVPDMIYALAFCRGDVNSSACRECLTAAFMDAQQLCAYNKDATIFYDPCFLRYSNLNFLDSINGGGNEFVILMPSREVTTSGKVYEAITGVLDNGDKSLILFSTQNVTGALKQVVLRLASGCKKEVAWLVGRVF
ncbi:unnamed protein product [Urochloa humidicola]